MNIKRWQFAVAILIIVVGVSSWVYVTLPVQDTSLLTPNGLPLRSPPPAPSPPGPDAKLGGTVYFDDSKEVPVQMTGTASSTSIVFNDFSFTLPSSSWDAKAALNYGSSYSLRVSNSSTGVSFYIDCPPIGRGAGGVSGISTETRSYMKNGKEYELTLDKLTAPQNSPWHWFWVRSVESENTLCLGVSDASPETTIVMQALYETWK